MMKLMIVVLLLGTTAGARCQHIKKKPFQFSFLPGVGSNGIDPGAYNNYFSLNLTAGYSNANLLFEIGILLNLNVSETRGIQIAGLANITGGNAFTGLTEKEISKKIREGIEMNLSGFQFSGAINGVRGNVFGGQITGGINATAGALQGIQIAGLANTVGKYTFGLQLSAVLNRSAQSMDGIQLAVLFNTTKGQLFGFQGGIINHAGTLMEKTLLPKIVRQPCSWAFITHVASWVDFNLVS
jgi:hypothetical protein